MPSFFDAFSRKKTRRRKCQAGLAGNITCDGDRLPSRPFLTTRPKEELNLIAPWHDHHNFVASAGDNTDSGRYPRFPGFACLLSTRDEALDPEGTFPGPCLLPFSIVKEKAPIPGILRDPATLLLSISLLLRVDSSRPFSRLGPTNSLHLIRRDVSSSPATSLPSC